MTATKNAPIHVQITTLRNQLAAIHTIKHRFSTGFGFLMMDICAKDTANTAVYNEFKIFTNDEFFKRLKELEKDIESQLNELSK